MGRKLGRSSYRILPNNLVFRIAFTLRRVIYIKKVNKVDFDFMLAIKQSQKCVMVYSLQCLVRFQVQVTLQFGSFGWRESDVSCLFLNINQAWPFVKVRLFSV